VCALAIGRRNTELGDKNTDHRPQLKAAPGLVAPIAICGALLATWWLFVADPGWPRHGLPAAYLLFPLAMIVTVRRSHRGVGAVGRSWSLDSVVLPLVIAAVLAGGVRHAITSVDVGATLNQQREVASFIDRLPDARVGGVGVAGWEQVPEIALLAQAHFRPLPASGGLYLTKHEYEGTHNADFDEAVARCGEVLLDQYGYLLCFARPTQPTS
jgi:hypothetical protein